MDEYVSNMYSAVLISRTQKKEAWKRKRKEKRIREKGKPSRERENIGSRGKPQERKKKR